MIEEVAMKTFKLVSFQVIEDNEVRDIELKDGLIINKEDDKNHWLLEAYTNQTHYDFFQDAFINQRDIIVQVVISKKENDPATFQTKVCIVKKIDQNLSILFKGTLKRTKNHYAEILLDHLVHKGLTGDALMIEFKDKMKTKPRIENFDKTTT
jgi:hypothetical protein